MVINQNTGDEIVLPRQDTISFGRLDKLPDGTPANDIVITHSKPVISRWHFELRRKPDGYYLRQLSPQTTEVDGKAVAKGDEAAIEPGSEVRLANEVFLQFGAPLQEEATLYGRTLTRPPE
ncbi:MAG: FHA domain-containing protein [Proteobacteria bacterium]|nr:FHA domain-containing protein [Pseudomonadota bacterium]